MFMDTNRLRKEVRAVLSELMQQDISAYYPNSENKFPKEDEGFVKLPEEINTKEDYLINWNEVSDNNDLYNFPMNEFKKGIQAEKAKNNIFNILDIAKIVINNLGENPQFYTNLGI